MKKKTIIFSLILLLVIGLSVYFLPEGTLSTLSGVSVMSISNANYIESGELKEGFLFDIVVNGGGESISMVVQPEDIERAGLEILPEVFTVQMELKNPVCTYRIEDTEDKIYRLYQATVRHSLVGGRCGGSSYGLEKPCPYDKINLNTVKAACQDKWNPPTDLHNPEYCGKTYAAPGTGVESPGSTLPLSANCNSLVDIQKVSLGEKFGADPSEWCYSMQRNIAAGWDDDHWEVSHIAGEPFYNVQNIGTKAFLEYDVIIEVTNSEGVVSTATLNSRDKVADLGAYGRIKLVGNLLADEFCENPAINYDILENKGKIKFAKRSDVDRYQFNLKNLQNFDNNYYVYKQTDPGVGRDVLWFLISSANGALNEIYNQNVAPNGCSITNNQVICEPETQVAYPNIQLLLESTYVGISEDRRQEIQNRIGELEGTIDDLSAEQLIELEKLRAELAASSAEDRADLENEINSLNQEILKLDQLRADLEDATVENKAELQTRIDGLSNVIGSSTRKQLEEILSLKTELSLTNAQLQPLLYIPTNGIPKILKANIKQDEIYNREVADLFTTVKNIGTDADSFDVDLRCGDDEISFGSKRISLKPNEQKDVNIKLNGDTGRYTCKVVAISVNQETNKDEKAITIIIKEKDIIKEPSFFEGKYASIDWMWLTIGGLVVLVLFLIIRSKKR